MIVGKNDFDLLPGVILALWKFLTMALAALVMYSFLAENSI